MTTSVAVKSVRLRHPSGRGFCLLLACSPPTIVVLWDRMNGKRSSMGFAAVTHGGIEGLCLTCVSSRTNYPDACGRESWWRLVSAQMYSLLALTLSGSTIQSRTFCLPICESYGADTSVAEPCFTPYTRLCSEWRRKRPVRKLLTNRS